MVCLAHVVSEGSQDRGIEGGSRRAAFFFCVLNNFEFLKNKLFLYVYVGTRLESMLGTRFGQRPTRDTGSVAES